MLGAAAAIVLLLLPATFLLPELSRLHEPLARNNFRQRMKVKNFTKSGDP
jgi:hypothetical protein